MATMTGRLYALASSLGMVDRNSKEDAFHQLVYGMTGKDHVSELSDAEKAAVQKELQERMRLKNHSEPLKKRSKPPEEVPGMITPAQRGYVWRLMYRLAELDPSGKTVCQRLIGVIQKELGVTAAAKDPFRFVDFDGGTKLIEQLKRYVRSAERKSAKKEAADNGY